MNAVAREYARVRRTGGRAEQCLAVARVHVWFHDRWSHDDETHGYISDDSQWRIRIVPDECCTLDDLAGDTFDVAAHASTVPGGERTIRAQEKRFKQRIERDGVWGYILEHKVAVCAHCGQGGQWEAVDSCFGFDDSDYCIDEAKAAAHYRMKERA